MLVIPIASESLGARGLSLFVTSEDQSILIDPSVSPAPFRNGHPPHLQEIAASFVSRFYIMKFFKLADIIIQTHYHADHYSLGKKRPYEFTNQVTANTLYSHPKKTILAKDPMQNINYAQKKRASWLWRRKNIPLFIADGNTYVFGRTRIVFSDPLPYGNVNSKQGWVVAVHISDTYGSTLITSDVVGPGSDSALNFITNNAADLIIIDGPSTYHPKQSPKEIESAFQRLVKVNDIGSIIVDHHLLRDLEWKTQLKEHGILYDNITLSSLLGLPPVCLESKRSLLHDKTPINSSFHKRFRSYDTLILQKIKSVAKTLPHHSKLSKQFKKITEIRNEKRTLEKT